MKKFFLCLSFLTTILTTTAQAKDHNFGIGLMGGDPVGVNAKFWFSNAIAADVAVGYSFLGPDGVQIHGDVLYHLFSIFDVNKGSMPIYLGVGSRLKFQTGDNKFGIRFPIGVEYIFDSAPIGIFAEAVPVLDLSPSTKAGFNGGAGIRWLF